MQATADPLPIDLALQRSPLDRMMGRWTLDTSPAYIAMDLMSRLLSPYDLNPLAYNPLRKILNQCIDFERLGRSPIKLFVSGPLRHPNARIRDHPLNGDEAWHAPKSSSPLCPQRRMSGRLLARDY
jgi:hypothetical protein